MTHPRTHHAVHPRPHHATPQRLVAEARAGFLAFGDVDTAAVRDAILDSWRRSQKSSVAADRVEVRYAGSPNLDTPLVQSAAPILEQLRDLLGDEPVSIILTDADGVVLSRFADDRPLERHLDSVSLAPGFTYAEHDVGTNGIGTALAQNRPLGVFGAEHYAEGLAGLACFGAPIPHPITGRTVGALDLTCWNRDASIVLPTLVTTTVQQLRHALLTASSRRELALLRCYGDICRRTDLPVLATNNDVMVMNEAARTTLSVEDQTRLLERATEAIDSGWSRTLDAELSDGTGVQIDCTPAWTGAGRLAGCVLTVSVVAPVVTLSTRRRSLTVPLPGLAGSSPAWKRCCAEAVDAHRSRTPLLLVGEAGVGKLSLANAVHQHYRPGTFAEVFDATGAVTAGWFDSVAEALTSDRITVILRRLDLLPQEMVPQLAELLHESLGANGSDDTPRVIATSRTPQIPDELHEIFHAQVSIPPLRQRLRDLNQIIRALLARLRPRGRVRCSPQAQSILLRGRWTGNVSELQEALAHAVRRCRAGTIEPEDLPPRYRAVGRRLLTPLESLERDAIIESLAAADGDKLRAANSLKMSRATIYRKIRRYGIDLVDA